MVGFVFGVRKLARIGSQKDSSEDFGMTFIQLIKIPPKLIARTVSINSPGV
jgi:hypothetical protein